MHEITVLSPHRDDAAFSLYFALSQWSRRNIRLRVVNFFTRSAYAPYVPFESVAAVSAIRRREDRSVLRALGSIEVIDAGLLDAPLRYGIPVEEVSGNGTSSRISDKDISALTAHIPGSRSGIWIAPLALGDHVDHQVVKIAACCAIEARRLAFFEDLPYATWTPSELLRERVQDAERLTGSRLRPLLIRGVRTVFRKRQLVGRYSSQIAFEQAARIAHWSSNFGGGERLWVPAHSRLWQPLLRLG